MKNKSLIIKIALSVILLALSVIFVYQMADIQAAEVSRIIIKNTKTVMETKDKLSVCFSGVCIPKETDDFFDRFESYDVYYANKSILNVKLVQSETPAKNGFYQVEFEIPGTKKTAFITGLTAGNVKTTQDELIANYTGKDDFSSSPFRGMTSAKGSPLATWPRSKPSSRTTTARRGGAARRGCKCGRRMASSTRRRSRGSWS